MTAIAQTVIARGVPAGVMWLRRVDAAPHDVAGVLARGRDGHCVFHRNGACAIHADAGHAALPSACQHFPRTCLIDPRGVFVTLSHYCPTAASLLFDAAGEVAIVAGPPALPDGATPEGLDARDALPPMRTPRMLMGLDEYTDWERRAIALLTSGLPPAEALNQLDQYAETATKKEPASFPAARKKEAGSFFRVARAAVPAPYSWPAPVAPAPIPADASSIAGRFLAAHAFGCWMAYEGNGLASVTTYLRTVLAVLQIELARCGDLREAIRQSDLLLRHLVDREAFAEGITSVSV